MKELELLEAICRGVDPRDGTFLDTPRDPDLDRARLAYLGKLRRFAKRYAAIPAAAEMPVRPLMHGKAWKPEDDEALKKAWDGDSSATAAVLGERFGRGEGAIIARLVRIGLFSDREKAAEANAARAAHGGGGSGE